MGESIDLKGKTAIVTGATGGIGKEIARGLARLGASVVIGARDAETGKAAAGEIVADTANTSVVVQTVDVAHGQSIRAFVKEFEAAFDRLDILVNNAGVWLTDRRTSPDGHELTFATNVLGPHLLSSLLLPRLRASGAARIVNVVSGLASNYDAEDLDFARRKYDGFKAYAQSKQALRMLTWGLADRLDGTGVTVNAAAPGFVRTGFNRHAHGFTATMINIFARLFAVSPAKGADTPLWVATAPELAGVTGRYFDKRREHDGKFREPAAIVDLERRCDAMVAAPSKVSLHVRRPLQEGDRP
jgi:NAD(P)-dependent dehydrogenase (short-subunit alcohol dehydrogenase family)